MIYRMQDAARARAQRLRTRHITSCQWRTLDTMIVICFSTRSVHVANVLVSFTL